MTRPGFSLLSTMVFVLAGALACTSSEPNDDSAPMPDLVYAEQHETTALWSIYGYTEGEGSREIAPGPTNLPRPAQSFLLVRPTTGELLYVSEDSGNEGYILLNPATGKFQRLNLPGVVQSWSPGGDLLVTGVENVATVVTVGGAVRTTVCGPPVICGVPQWTPSGDAIVVFRRPAGDQADLWLVPLDGSAELNLTQTPTMSEIGPSFSPDGRHLVYERQPGFELVVSNADGSEASPLIAPVGLGNFPWSPDGLGVAVDASVGDRSGLVLVPLSGDPRVITPPGETLVVVSHIAWSPDGNRLAYEAFDGTASDAPGAFVINADGSGRRQVNTPGNPASGVAWIPELH